MYSRLSKMLCGSKDQVRARRSGEKCGLALIQVIASDSAAISASVACQPEITNYTDVICNLPKFAQRQRPGCSVSTNAQDVEDCHAAVAARNDD